jgi:hypothetical protein
MEDHGQMMTRENVTKKEQRDEGNAEYAGYW